MNSDIANSDIVLGQGTTPTIRWNFSATDESTITTLYMTIKQRNNEDYVEKTIDDATIGDGYVDITLTQEDTLLLDNDEKCYIQLRWKTSDGYAGRSPIIECTSGDLLKEGEI